MGKSLVIKGADFSENGISTSATWIAQYPSDILIGGSGRVVSSDVIFFPIASEVTRLNMVGKTIRFIKLNAAAAGTISVYTIATADGSPSNEQSLSVAAGVNILELNMPISINSDAVSVGLKGNGIIRYWAASGSYPSRGWLYAEGGAARIPIDFGYEV